MTTGDEMLLAVKSYSAKGWVVHPLYRTTDKCKSPGKQPLIQEWQKLTKTLDGIENYVRKGYNIGLVTGKASGVDGIDIDNEAFKDELLADVDGFELKTLISGHCDGRGHILFQHEDDMLSDKHHFIGIEYFGNNAEGAGGNLVLPPSIHHTGEVYRWKDADAPLMKMPDKLKENIRSLFKREDELHVYFKKCRPCFTMGNRKYDKTDPRSKGLWERPDTIPIHDKSGRDAILAIMGELKAHGCPDDLLLMCCKRFFGKDYDGDTTKKELQYVEAMHPKCETLRQCLNIDCEGCTWTWTPPKEAGAGSGSGDGKKSDIVQKSFVMLPDGKIAEEVWDGYEAKFALWNGTEVKYVADVTAGTKKYVPRINEAITTGAVKLPTNAMEYGSLQELADEIQAYIHEYLDISLDMEVFATWYILLSWVYDRVNTLPYLRALGDTGTGKSRYLDVIGGLTYKPCMVSGAITPAPIYRMIRQWGGTIVLDEADFKNSDEKNEVITILNCGFEKGRPVIRCDQNNADNLQFLPTYCPKVIASRFSFDDKALESRCLTERMTPTDRTDIPKVLPTRFYEKQQELRNKLLLFRFKHYYLINGDAGDGLEFGNIEPRLQQATQSFAALFANVPELMDRFKAFLKEYNKELIDERGDSFDGMLVRALVELMDNGFKDISSRDIGDKMVELFGLDIVTPQSVGKHLKSLNIKTERAWSGSKRNNRVVVLDALGLKQIDRLKRRYIYSDVSEISKVRQVQNNENRGGAVDKNDFAPNAPCTIGDSTNGANSVHEPSMRQVQAVPHTNGAIGALGANTNTNSPILTKATPTNTEPDYSSIALHINEMLSEFYGVSPPREIIGNIEWLISELTVNFSIPKQSAKRIITDAFKARGWI